jgi:glycosyltransferase involved in cell wall biosynthesis
MGRNTGYTRNAEPYKVTGLGGKMRILVLQDADWLQKGPHHQHHLMELLSKKGYDIIVVGFNQLWKNESHSIVSKRKIVNNISRFYMGSKITYIQPAFVKIPVLDYVSFSFTARATIKNLIKQYKPDIVISFTSIITSYWGMKISQEENIPYIYYWTDVIHTLVPIKTLQPIAKLIERETIKGSSRVMAINEVLKDYTVSIGAKPEHTVVLPGGIDFDRFDPCIPSNNIRERYHISGEDYVLFFMGWIYEFSGLKEVIIDLSKENDSHLKLLVVGEGDYFRELQDLTKYLNVQDRVIFTGWRPYDEIPHLIASADVCLLPAYNNETMRDIVPIKLYEYLAMAKPVICTRLPGVLKEFGYDNGIVYIDKPEDVFSCIKQLNKSRIDDLKEDAMRFIKNYSWGSIVSEFETLLKSVRV